MRTITTWLKNHLNGLPGNSRKAVYRLNDASIPLGLQVSDERTIELGNAYFEALKSMNRNCHRVMEPYPVIMSV